VPFLAFPVGVPVRPPSGKASLIAFWACGKKPGLQPGARSAYLLEIQDWTSSHLDRTDGLDPADKIEACLLVVAAKDDPCDNSSGSVLGHST